MGADASDGEQVYSLDSTTLRAACLPFGAPGACCDFAVVLTDAASRINREPVNTIPTNGQTPQRAVLPIKEAKRTQCMFLEL